MIRFIHSYIYILYWKIIIYYCPGPYPFYLNKNKKYNLFKYFIIHDNYLFFKYKFCLQNFLNIKLKILYLKKYIYLIFKFKNK